MRLALAASWGIALAACSCDCGDPVFIVDDDAGAQDGGVAFDAGEKPGDDGGAVVDAGPQELDAGSEPDAGPLCVLDVPPTPFVCEGDEDFCDPLGDVYTSPEAPPPLPQVDLLAAWSRVEDGVFVVDLRFAAPPFTSMRAQEIGVFLWEDDDPATDDLAFLVQSSPDDVLRWCDRLFVVGSGQPGTYVPASWRTEDGGGGPPFPLDACTDIDVSDDGLTLRIRMSGQALYSAGRSYLLVARLPPGITEDIPPGAPLTVLSLGGAPDNVVFQSICVAGCPGDGGDG